MSTDCLEYQQTGQSSDFFELRYQIGNEIVWARILREDIEGRCGRSGNKAGELGKEADVIFAKVGAWIARAEARQRSPFRQYRIKKDLFQQIMSGTGQ